MTFKSFFIALFAAALVTLFAGQRFISPAQAGALYLGSGMLAPEESRWKSYTYLSWDVLESANSMSSSSVAALSDKLKMEERSPWSRGLFLLTAGQVQARFAWANSVIGHEHAHFQQAHRFGLTKHCFRDEESGRKFDWEKAWRRSFLHGDPGGPAFSSPGPDGFDWELDAQEGITRHLAGLNWQMGYTERRLRGWLAGESRTVFDAADFVLNRAYTMGYTAGSRYGANGAEMGGDTGNFASHIAATTGERDVLAKMLAVSAVSNILSPSVFAMSGSVDEYLFHGKMEVKPRGRSLPRGGAYTWDIPQYLNKDNMSVSPTFYWMPGSIAAKSLGADQLALGLGLETAVIGKADQELRATVNGQWGRLDLGAGLSAGWDGQFIELDAAYAITDRAAITVGTVARFGQTMRAERNLPDAGSVSWAGLRLSF